MTQILKIISGPQKRWMKEGLFYVFQKNRTMGVSMEKTGMSFKDKRDGSAHSVSRGLLHPPCCRMLQKNQGNSWKRGYTLLWLRKPLNQEPLEIGKILLWNTCLAYDLHFCICQHSLFPSPSSVPRGTALLGQGTEQAPSRPSISHTHLISSPQTEDMSGIKLTRIDITLDFGWKAKKGMWRQDSELVWPNRPNIQFLSRYQTACPMLYL